MKKILTASLVAIMAVTAANAEIASTGYVETRVGVGKGTDGAFMPGDFTGAAANETNLQAAVNAVASAVVEIEGSAAYNSGITEALVTQIGNNKTAIETLNGAATEDGSVAKAVADAKTELEDKIAKAQAAATYDDTAVRGLISALDNAKQAKLTTTNLKGAGSVDVNIAGDGTITISGDELSAATSSNLGGVKIGSNVNVAADGTISVASGNTSGAGLVQLTDTVNANDSTMATTGKAVDAAVKVEEEARKAADEALQGEIDAAEVSIEGLQATLGTLSTDSGELRNDLDTLGGRVDTLENDVNAIEANLGEGFDEANTVASAIGTINTNLGALAGKQIPVNPCTTGRCSLVWDAGANAGAGAFVWEAIK